MIRIHETVAFVVIAIFTVGWVWGLGALIVRKDPGSRFWTWIAVEQIVAALQALIGITLLLLGYRLQLCLVHLKGAQGLTQLLLVHH